jgi:hypothetical protein
MVYGHIQILPGQKREIFKRAGKRYSAKRAYL